MNFFLVFFLLFLLQFIVLLFGISPFEGPKVIISELSIILLLFFAILKNHISKLQDIPIGFLLLIFLTIFTLIFQLTSVSFLGNAFRMQGIFSLLLLLGFALVSAKIHISIRPIFILAILLVQGIAVFVIEGTIAGRAVGTLGEPNSLAAATLFIWPWLIRSEKLEARSMKFFPFKKENIFLYSGIFVSLLTIFLSGSRSGMLGFLIQLIFLGFLRLKFSFVKASIIGILLLFSSLLLPFFQTNTLYENRTEIWYTALVTGRESPFFGHGVGNTEIVLKETSKKLHNFLQGSYVDSSHNIFLDWWVQGGFVGVTAIVFLVYTAVKESIQSKQSREFVLLLGVVTMLLFNPVSVVTLIHFWWLIGQSSLKTNN